MIWVTKIDKDSSTNATAVITIATIKNQTRSIINTPCLLVFRYSVALLVFSHLSDDLLLNKGCLSIQFKFIVFILPSLLPLLDHPMLLPQEGWNIKYPKNAWVEIFVEEKVEAPSWSSYVTYTHAWEDMPKIFSFLFITMQALRCFCVLSADNIWKFVRLACTKNFKYYLPFVTKRVCSEIVVYGLI